MDEPNPEELRSTITDACYIECSDCGAKAVVAAGIKNRNSVDEEDAARRLLKEKWVVNENGFLMCGAGEGKGCASRRGEGEEIIGLYYV